MKKTINSFTQKILFWLQHSWWLLLLACLVIFCASFGLFYHQQMFYSHDYLHAGRIAEMARGLVEGQFPVIWSGNFAFGYGMPLFEFYAPLPYLVGALLSFLGFDLIVCTKLLFFISNIGTFTGVYYWSREFSSRPLSLLAASFATLASYRAVDIFARGAMSEIWAIMALAWLFAGVSKIILGKRYGWRISIFAGVALALSHNLTALMAVPILTIYVLLLSVQLFFAGEEKNLVKQLRRRWGLLLSAGLTCFALSAFYLLPALGEKNLVQIDNYILSDYFDYHLHFVYLRQFFLDNFGHGGSGWGPHDGLSFFLGHAQWWSLVLGGLLLIYQLIKRLFCRHEQQKTPLLPFLVLALPFLLSLYLATDKSLWWWQLTESFFSYIQFPWRFLGLSLLLMAVLAPLAFGVLVQRWHYLIMGAFLLLLIFTSSNPLLVASQGNYQQWAFARTGNYFKPEQIFSDGIGHYRGDSDYIQATLSGILVDYLPAQFANAWQPPVREIINLEPSQYEVLINKMHQRLYQINLVSPQLVELAIADYPHWTAELDGQATIATTSAQGNLQVFMPEGSHRLGVSLCPTLLRFLATGISLLTLVILVGESIYSSWKKITRKH